MTEKEEEQSRNAKIPEFRKDFDDYMQKRQEAAQRETVGQDYKIRFEREEVAPLANQKQDYEQRFDKDFEAQQKRLNIQNLEERDEFNTWMKQERSHLRQLDNTDRFTPGGDYTDRPESTSRTHSGFPHREVPRAVAAEQMRDEFDTFQDTLHQSRLDALEANLTANFEALAAEYGKAQRREELHELKNVAPTRDPHKPLAEQIGGTGAPQLSPAGRPAYQPLPGQSPEEFAQEMQQMEQRKLQQPEPILPPPVPTIRR